MAVYDVYVMIRCGVYAQIEFVRYMFYIFIGYILCNGSFVVV